MHLPQGTGRNGALQWWLEELHLLKDRLEESLGVTISSDNLKSAIKVCNRERKALKELHELNRLDPAPMTGLDLLTTIFVKGFNVDKEEGTGLINQLAEEVRDIAGRGFPHCQGHAPILLTGCPVGIGSEKVVRLLEEWRQCGLL